VETTQSSVKKLPIIGGGKLDFDIESELEKFEQEQMAVLGL